MTTISQCKNKFFFSENEFFLQKNPKIAYITFILRSLGVKEFFTFCKEANALCLLYV